MTTFARETHAIVAQRKKKTHKRSRIEKQIQHNKWKVQLMTKHTPVAVTNKHSCVVLYKI